ncbi:MAG: DUF4026 domain-containing protein [Phycisphaera sp. TMED9]|nr:MAG: DUF4026 domain-containing protein [Phycisphaera sp. TMED9]
MTAPSVHPSWRLAEPWPAILVAPHALAEPPELEGFLATLAGRLDETVEVMEFLPSADEKHPWSVLVRLPGQPTPVLISCERTKRMDEVPAGLSASVAASGFTIVVESLLDGADPRMIWGRLAMVAAVRPEAIAILDGATGRWFDRSEIDRDLSDLELGPPEDVLWRVQAVSGSENLDEGTVWLFTRGLLRCGLPELEMLEVPGRDAAAASKLIDALAGLLLEDGPPAPEIPYPLGPGIDVALIPWRDVVETLDSESLGSEADRAALSQETPNPLQARRAAICDIEPKGSFKRLWTWPQNAVMHFARADAAIYRSDVSTSRASAVARRSWAVAVEAHRSATPDTLLLAGIPLGADSEGRVEHAWLQVEKASTEGGNGRLLRATLDGRSAGTSIEFRAADLDGWRLVRGEHAIGPEDSIDPLGFVADAPAGGAG